MFEGLRLAHPVALAAAFTLTPLMTAGFARLFLRQTLSPAVLLALVLAGVGAHWVIFRADLGRLLALDLGTRSEEHTSELQSLMRSSYAVFCLKKKKHMTPHLFLTGA